jgi:O-antigen ligase
MSVAAPRREGSRLPAAPYHLLLVLAAVLVALADRPGSLFRPVYVVVLAGAAVGYLAYLRKPATVLTAYLFVLPMMKGGGGSGIHAGELTSGAVAIGGLATLLREREAVAPAVRRIVTLLFALALLGLFSSLANHVHGAGDLLNACGKYLIFAVVVVLASVHIDSAEKVETVLKVLIASAMLIAVYSIALYATGHSYYAQFGYSRATGTFENWNELGGYMAMMSYPTLFYGLWRGGRTRTLCIAGWGLQIVALLLSLTLGAVLGVVGAAAIGLLLFFRSEIVRVVPVVFAGAVVGMVVIAALPSVAHHFAIADARVQDRVATYQAGLHAVRAHWAVGTGSQAQVLDAVVSSARLSDKPISVVPHNAFIAIGVEKGIGGVVLLVLLILAVLRVLFRPRPRDSLALLHQGIALGALAFLIQNMSNLLLLHARLGILWLVLAAIDLKLDPSLGPAAAS